MKVLALNGWKFTDYADLQVYYHNHKYDDYENAYHISNITAYTVIYVHYSLEVVKILNESGIAAIIVHDEDELKILLKSNYTYDYDNDIVYLHDYSYYQKNQLRTDQWWLTTTDIEQYLPPTWTLKYIGYNGIVTRSEYNTTISIQNTATDDDIIFEYIYSNEVDFTQFFLKKLLERTTSALSFDRMSNRIFRERLYSRYPEAINIGPRNESMFLLLHYPKMENFAANVYTIKNVIRLPQSKWAGMVNTQFDIGQFKNMCNCLSSIYYFYFLYHEKPKIYMIGSAPSHWIKDLTERGINFTFETWDPLDTPYSNVHHKEMFFISDVKKLADVSVLYIDIRTDRKGQDWKLWRERVERETLDNLNIAYEFIKNRKRVVCCCKCTCMDLRLPSESIMLHFPTSQIRSEFYVLLSSKMNVDDFLYVSKGALYAYINSVKTNNVFHSPAYIFKNSHRKNMVKKPIIALYALSNKMNRKESVIDWCTRVNEGVLTFRLNNTFDNSCVLPFKDDLDNLYLPSDFTELKSTIITSYKGVTPMFGMSTSNDLKATGNNHIFLYLGSKYYSSVDKYANHMCISRRSHQSRFSEAASTLSGYFFRDISNGKYNLEKADDENIVSGHLYNALIWYRYTYTFDIVRWIQQQPVDYVSREGGNYIDHAPIEVNYARSYATELAIYLGDLTHTRYANEIDTYKNSVYSISCAEDPHYYIGLHFEVYPYKYDVTVPHSPGGLLFIIYNMIPDVVKIMEDMGIDVLYFGITTRDTYLLSDAINEANVSGDSATFYKFYMMFYREHTTIGLSRVITPQITLSFIITNTVRIDPTKLKIKSIYLRKIKGDTEYDMCER
uniref:Protein VP3 n=1 Tax=Rotavirus A TaxID=28875 RepID=A0A1V0FTY9_9REOV|nr:VP3 [Rotavirus A]